MADGSKRNQEKHNHHYTPALYLNNFTNAAGALHVVSRVNGRRWETSPTGLGYERDLYRPNDLADGEDPNKYEDAFATFEGAAAPVIAGILETRAVPQDEEQRGLLLQFIALQAVRLPSTRKLIAAPREHEARIIMDMLASSRSLYESHIRHAGYSLEDHPHEKFVAEQDDYEVRLTTEGFLEGAMVMWNAILPYLHSRSWSVLYSDRPAEQFVVSDHPVALTWSDGSVNRVGPGHAHLHTDLTFPIGSALALLGRFEPLASTMEASRESVAAVNAKTISLAQRFVAGCSDNFVVMSEAGIMTAQEFIAERQATEQK